MSDGIVMCVRVEDLISPMHTVPGSQVRTCNRCSEEIMISPVTVENIEVMDLELVCDICLRNAGVPDDAEMRTFDGAREEVFKALDSLGMDPDLKKRLWDELHSSNGPDALRLLLEIIEDKAKKDLGE